MVMVAPDGSLQGRGELPRLPFRFPLTRARVVLTASKLLVHASAVGSVWLSATEDVTKFGLTVHDSPLVAWAACIVFGGLLVWLVLDSESRVLAGTDGLRARKGFRTHFYPWGMVAAVAWYEEGLRVLLHDGRQHKVKLLSRAEVAHRAHAPVTPMVELAVAVERVRRSVAAPHSTLTEPVVGRLRMSAVLWVELALSLGLMVTIAVLRTVGVLG